MTLCVENPKSSREKKKAERDRDNYPYPEIQRKGARRGSEIPGGTCKEKLKPEDIVIQGERRQR